MVVVLEKNISQELLENIIKHLEGYNFAVHKSTGEEQIVLGAIGVQPTFDTRQIKVLEGVSEVYRITEPFKLASRSFKKENTEIKIKDVTIGGNEVVMMAGPCSVENEGQIYTIAEIVSKAGAKILRGGAFKPRTSPYSFQGLGEEGLKLIRGAADKYGLLVITEVMESAHIDLIEEYTDIFQIGARNMQNFSLLRDLGKTKKPIMMKRGLSATVEDLLMSAEYIMAQGNRNVILCERGVRTFETLTRNTLDLSAVPAIRDLSHLPVIVDPSHAVGRWDLVAPMAKAAVAAGADGVMLEVHPNPVEALSDGPQSLKLEKFQGLMEDLRRVAEAVGRSI